MSFSPDEVAIIFTALIACALDMRTVINAEHQAGRIVGIEMVQAHERLSDLLSRIQDRATVELARPA